MVSWNYNFSATAERTWTSLAWQNQKNRKMHLDRKIRKTADRARHQNRKTAVFKRKNRKPEPDILLDPQNRKPQRPLL